MGGASLHPVGRGQDAAEYCSGLPPQHRTALSGNRAKAEKPWLDGYDLRHKVRIVQKYLLLNICFIFFQLELRWEIGRRSGMRTQDAIIIGTHKQMK